MTIKKEMEAKKEFDYADDYTEEKKPKEKPEKHDNKYEILKLKRCVKDKDTRISKLEKRLNDRVKYYYTAGVIALFALLGIGVIYLAATDIEILRLWMIAIGVAASMIGCIILIMIFMFLIWGDEK